MKTSAEVLLKLSYRLFWQAPNRPENIKCTSSHIFLRPVGRKRGRLVHLQAFLQEWEINGTFVLSVLEL